MAEQRTAAVEVEIFGQTYQVRGADEGHLRDLAAEVDRKMRDLADHVVTADTARLAILVALNFAEELSQSRRPEDGVDGDDRERMARLTDELTAALELS